MNISQSIAMCHNVTMLDSMLQSQPIPYVATFSRGEMLTDNFDVPFIQYPESKFHNKVSNLDTRIQPTETTNSAASYRQAIPRRSAAAIEPEWIENALGYHALPPAGCCSHSAALGLTPPSLQMPVNSVRKQPLIPLLAGSYSRSNTMVPSGSSHVLSPVTKIGAPLMTIPTPSELLSPETTKSNGIGGQEAPTGCIERKRTTRRLVRSYTRSGLKKPQAVMRAEAKAGKTSEDQSRKLSVVLGLEPTDPDTISVHERKRSYCEALEQYVLYLHEQLRLTNNEPAPIERLTEYRGLTSRSIRTLLAHMSSRLEVVHDKIQEAEREFLDLRRQVAEKRSDTQEPQESGQVEFLPLALQMLEEE